MREKVLNKNCLFFHFVIVVVKSSGDDDVLSIPMYRVGRIAKQFLKVFSTPSKNQ